MNFVLLLILLIVSIFASPLYCETSMDILHVDYTKSEMQYTEEIRNHKGNLLIGGNIPIQRFIYLSQGVGKFKLFGIYDTNKDSVVYQYENNPTLFSYTIKDSHNEVKNRAWSSL